MSPGSSSIRIGLLLAVLVGCADDPPIEIISRATWGSVETERGLPEHTISKITIHHGGVTFDDTRDPAEYLRALQSWSRGEKGWIDIPYHFVIDLDGRIYEARPIRFPGDTNTSYDPRSHALIEVLGNYDNRELNDAQFESIAKLSAHLAKRYSVALTDIRSHRDYAAGETTCPGANIYRHFEDGSLLQRISELAR